MVLGLYAIDVSSKKASLDLEETKKNLQSLIDGKVNECVDIYKGAITLYVLGEKTKHIWNRKISDIEVEKLSYIVDVNLKRKETLIKDTCINKYEVFQKILLSEED